MFFNKKKKESLVVLQACINRNGNDQWFASAQIGPFNTQEEAEVAADVLNNVVQNDMKNSGIMPVEPSITQIRPVE